MDEYSMDEVKLAYAAGIIDGKGCVSLTICKRPNITSRYECALKVAVTMTDRGVPQWLKNTFGGSLSIHLPAKPGYREYYSWMIESRQAVKFLGDILPWLRIKIPQTKLAFQFQELKSSGEYERQLLKPQEAYRKELELVGKMRRLNNRGKQRGNQIDLSTL